MNGELAEGMSDGGYKKLNRDRGGFVERTSQEARSELDPAHAYVESPIPTLPDGTTRFARGSVDYNSPMRHQG
jgi:hypothetical protein